jgi:tryptophanyl-tRNA synthetase
MVLKRLLVGVMEAVLAPMRESRSELASDRSYVHEELREGPARANEITHAVLRDVREAFSLGAPL